MNKNKCLANAKRPCDCRVLCLRLKSSLCSFVHYISFSDPLGHLGVTYALHLWLVGKPVVDFIFVVIKHFHYLLWLRRYERKSVEVGVFRRGWVTLSADFRGKGASPTNHCWCQKTRVIAVSCGIKISGAHHLVLSQYMHLTDRRTDGRMDRQNSDSNTMHCIMYSRTVEIIH